MRRSPRACLRRGPCSLMLTSAHLSSRSRDLARPIALDEHEYTLVLFITSNCSRFFAVQFSVYHLGRHDLSTMGVHDTSTAALLDAHRNAGRAFTAARVGSFVREEGSGPAVVCVHGMWGSSFLYRKVLHELAARDLRGIAWDLPGFGFAERPPDYDYSWTGLGRFCVAAVDALGLDRFHLVVHDIGGPVGFELAAEI